MIGRRTFLGISAALSFATALPQSLARAAHFAGRIRRRWSILPTGGIAWKPAPGEVHRDFIEMSGERIAIVIRYGVDESGLVSVTHRCVWPMLRFHPNLTDSHLGISFGPDAVVEDDVRFSPGVSPPIKARLRFPGSDEDYWWPLTPSMTRCVHEKGVTRIEGTMKAPGGWSRLAFRRAIFPSTTKPIAFDVFSLTNTSTDTVDLEADDFERVIETPGERGIYGAYHASARLEGAGMYQLLPGHSATLAVVFEARRREDRPVEFDLASEEQARISRIERVLDRMQLETPDPVLNTAFDFAKIHAVENIFRTKGGLMHAPGGGTRYYAAIWANDQAEYANPFFAMLGDPIATESAINSFRHFARFMNPEYRPIPSSIVGEGENFWNGAGDRGDMAMIAYGAARFALAYGDERTARELWPLIEWCLEYLRRKVTPVGVIASDSDELEGRFPSGKANLSTAALAYDALLSASALARELGKPKAMIAAYDRRAKKLRVAIERYFGANVEGFATYRYFDKSDTIGQRKPAHANYSRPIESYANGPDILRSWIALPLTVGIFERSKGTLAALFSPRLWTGDGLATEAGQTTVWDRSTLYGLRGAFAAGDTARALAHLTDYSERRLLGDHVPYPFEAYPEGGKAQLSAESALYCRVFTEGLFGIRPIGFRTFELRPRLPEGWPAMALRRLRAFGATFDIVVRKATNGSLEIQTLAEGRPERIWLVPPGGMTTITL